MGCILVIDARALVPATLLCMAGKLKLARYGHHVGDMGYRRGSAMLAMASAARYRRRVSQRAIRRRFAGKEANKERYMQTDAYSALPGV